MNVIPPFVTRPSVQREIGSVVADALSGGGGAKTSCIWSHASRGTGGAAVVVIIGLSGCAANPGADASAQNALSSANGPVVLDQPRAAASQSALPAQGVRLVSGHSKPAAAVESSGAAASPANDPSQSDRLATFATRHAVYTRAGFTELPGWSNEKLDESWTAFLRSCRVLGSKPGWTTPCAAASNVDAQRSESIRTYFERYFVAYRIQSIDRSARGILTGYYEPIVHGSLRYAWPYVYPVYGTPRDMLYLDARRLPAGAPIAATAARIDGHSVVPLAAVSTGSLSNVYMLDVGNSVPDIRDKRIRLRLEDRRIVPYYTRAEIEQRTLKASVLAYVDDPVTLYSMQLQGSGKIVLPDRSVIRIAYAEQNGHAFRPPVAATMAASTNGRHILVRGAALNLDDDATQTVTSSTGGVPATNTAAGGGREALPSFDKPTSPLLRDATVESDIKVDETSASTGAGDRKRGFLLIDPPVASGNSARAHATSQPKQSNNGTQGDALADVKLVSARVTTATAPLLSGQAQAPVAVAGSATPRRPVALSDPSYVFFRSIPDSPDGPLGSLGVPLSAGRSVAIDPRTTPLGAPVYLSVSNTSDTVANTNRLLMAQDAGGAIRGAVRADLYFGSGPAAQAGASTLKATAQMWILVPAGLNLTGRQGGLRTRGADVQFDADCVLDDPDLCVEDAP